MSLRNKYIGLLAVSVLAIALITNKVEAKSSLKDSIKATLNLKGKLTNKN